jgi:hypothetical protein
LHDSNHRAFNSAIILHHNVQMDLSAAPAIIEQPSHRGMGRVVLAPSWLGKHSQLFEPHISLIVQFAVVAHRVIWLMKATRASAAALHQLASVLVNRLLFHSSLPFLSPHAYGNIWYMPHIIGAGLSSRAAAELGLLPGTTV